MDNDTAVRYTKCKGGEAMREKKDINIEIGGNIQVAREQAGYTQDTSDCMDKRNRYMVDHADYILAVWNGCPSGTGNTVRYAHKKGKTVIVINPVSLDVTRE